MTQEEMIIDYARHRAELRREAKWALIMGALMIPLSIGVLALVALVYSLVGHPGRAGSPEPGDIEARP